jgi:hypothetical protein
MEKKQVGARIGRRSFISAILILLVLMIGAGLLTRLVPADEYQRTTQAGREVLDPSSFHLTAAHPLPVWRWFTGPVEVLWSSDALMVIAIIVFILLVGGSFAVLDRAGVLRTIIEHIATTFRPRRYILIAVICLFFMGMGALLGIFEEVVPLIPIIIPLAWFRIIVFAVMYCIVTLFVVTYARRIEGNPSSSLVYAEERAVRARYQESIDHTETEAPRRAVVWAVSCLMAMLVIILMGPFVKILQTYSLPIIGIAFVTAGLGAGLFSGIGSRKTFATFAAGVGGMASRQPSRGQVLPWQACWFMPSPQGSLSWLSRSISDPSELHMTTRIPKDYSTSRERFRSRLADISRLWPQVVLTTHPVANPDGEDLSIDILDAPATGAPRHLLLVTTGEHGIECFVGSAVLDLLMEQVVPTLNPTDTALCLVHCINPWGMAHEQRTNAANVDLNRNFIVDWDTVEQRNPQYHELQYLFQPQGPVPQVAKDRLRTARSVLQLALSGRSKLLRQALLVGQYDEPKGLYYGGTTWQPETCTMRTVYDECLRSAPHVVHVDLHTGYGPRDRMSVVNSGFDPVPSAEWKQRIGYPRVVAATSQEFHRIEGDMIDYMYRTREIQASQTAMYATCFEFGCLGDSLKSDIDSLWCAIASNRLRQFSAINESIAQQVRKLWREAYCPSDPAWERRACANALLATRGILHDQGLTG